MSFWHFITTILGIGYVAFVFWMLIDCIKYEDDRNERVCWAMFLLCCGILFAWVYLVQRHLPRRRELRRAVRSVAA